ncbi:hypothetical protein HMPREF9629_00863 [Peptoanaerobacter stomatis]|uniref:Uncharacterized protein n=1 Tax=Peptoanaerobacter stomatis TaxID=796937 RepID=G9X3A6_9FIRM|nr:hypothetical protein [Peptoanaerobacter stomatis]EHL10648.1 hypothetical protein HMPREF9629_00863 [Peptoanaerobacter stomatis]
MSINYMNEILNYLNTSDGEKEIENLRKTYYDILESYESEKSHYGLSISNFFNKSIENISHTSTICSDLSYKQNGKADVVYDNINLDFLQTVPLYCNNNNLFIKYCFENTGINLQNITKIKGKEKVALNYVSNINKLKSIDIEGGFNCVSENISENYTRVA